MTAIADHPFVVERYWPGASAEDFRHATHRLTACLAALAATGVCAKLLHSTYVPVDESAQWVIAAESASTVEDACAAAGIPYQRLLFAVESDPIER